MNDIRGLLGALDRRADQHAPSEQSILNALELERQSGPRRAGSTRMNKLRWVVIGVAAAAVAAVLVVTSFIWSGNRTRLAAAGDALSGTAWVLDSVTVNGESTTIPSDLTRYTLTFGSDGLLTAGTSCVAVTGQWSPSVDGFSLTDPGTSAVACSNLATESAEHLRIRAQLDAAIYSLNGDTQAMVEPDELHVTTSGLVLNYASAS